MATDESVPEMSVSNDLTFIWLEITAKCNLICSHCYADSGPKADLHGNMAFEDWTRVIDEAADVGCRSLQFIGGEPTLHPRLDDLVDHANHRGFEFIEVFTNATHLGKELIGCFQRGGVRVATSFYSDDPAVHEEITHGRGSWRHTVRGIESVLAAGLPIRVGVIETERNRGHGPRAVAFLKNLGIQNVRTDRERGVGRGKLVRLGNEGERYNELCGECWKGKLCVTSTGDVFPCVFSRATRLGDAKAGLSAILQTAKLADFREKVREIQARMPAVPSRRQTFDPTMQEQCPPVTDPCNPTFCGPDGPCQPQACPPGDACNPQLCNPCQPCGPS